MNIEFMTEEGKLIGKMSLENIIFSIGEEFIYLRESEEGKLIKEEYKIINIVKEIKDAFWEGYLIYKCIYIIKKIKKLF